MRPHRDLHVLTPSFPPRRSSDLPSRRREGPPRGRGERRDGEAASAEDRAGAAEAPAPAMGQPLSRKWTVRILRLSTGLPSRVAGRNRQRLRSEEHTSELQSLMRISYAVFCLKKKNTKHRC